MHATVAGLLPKRAIEQDRAADGDPRRVDPVQSADLPDDAERHTGNPRFRPADVNHAGEFLAEHQGHRRIFIDGVNQAGLRVPPSLHCELRAAGDVFRDKGRR